MNKSTSVPVPEPGLTPAEMIARARALRPKVRAEAAAAEERGYYSAALHEEFTRAGFHRILQPRRFGGYEFDIRTFFQVMIEIATGDPGIGWCLCLGAGHALQIGSYFAEETQAKIFGPDGHFVAPLSGSGTGPDCEAVAVEGGYRVSGHWRYCSGIPYATHFTGMARPVGVPEGEPPGRKLALVVVPRGQFDMLDDWQRMFGLRGSGSNSVTIKDALIPKDFLNDRVFSDEIANGTPGSRLHNNPMYGGLFLGFAAGELACSQVGAARAALAELEEIIKASRPRFEPEVFKYQHHDWQRVFGLALSMTNAAEAILLRTGELYLEYCRANADGSGRFTMAEALQLQGMQHQAVRLSWEAGIGRR